MKSTNQKRKVDQSVPGDCATSAGSDGRRDEQFEQWLGNLLRVGVLLAAGVVIIGGGVYLTRHGLEQPELKVFRGEPAIYRNPSGIFRNAFQFGGRGLIQVGLLLLVATPVARVMASVVGFLRERDFVYVALTMVVLSVLLFSLLAGEIF